MAAGVKVLVAMQVNCGFAQVAMLELSHVPTGQPRANLDKDEPSEKFRVCFLKIQISRCQTKTMRMGGTHPMGVSMSIATSC